MLRSALILATVLMIAMVGVQVIETRDLLASGGNGNGAPSIRVPAPEVATVPPAPPVIAPEGQPHRGENELPKKCVELGPKFTGFLKKYLGEKKKKRLVYNCEPNKKRFCGGTGDRMRGIAGLFFLAMVTDREFGIYAPYPAPLTAFYRESHVKWHIAEEKEIEAIPVDTSMMRLQKHHKFMKFLSSKETDDKDVRAQSNSFDPTPYAVAEPRLRAKIADMGLGGCNITCFYGCMFDLLFELNDEARKMVDSTIGGKGDFVGMQVRVSGPMATGLQIPEKWRTHPAAFPLFWEVLDGIFEKTPKMKLFVTTDAPDFLKMVEKKYGSRVFSTPGEQFNHTDSSELHSLRPEKYKLFDDTVSKTKKFQLTLLNNYVLGESAEMVMAQSGFGDTAFWRTKKTATCIFVNIDTYRSAWKHRLVYANPSQSVQKRNNKIIQIEPP
eukprot:TRINITY_DN20062_c0_g1_i1.p1 TRINITY_DN20062_c0_g1~~TRINITY_DN20062_c0_g1_i1.p1  ORF type:complete len:466 (+),score=97.62 TRINITY_DN20062_c0_g1_i1:80-1399(+)